MSEVWGVHDYRHARRILDDHTLRRLPMVDAAQVTTTRKPTRAKHLGIDDAEYARLLAAQDGHCAICPNEPKTRRLHVDHDHTTGDVRGLLCFRCNRAVPYWVTSEWALALFGYLKNAEQG